MTNKFFLFASIHAFLASVPSLILSYFPHLLPGIDFKKLYLEERYLASCDPIVLEVLMRMVYVLVLGYAFLYFFISQNPNNKAAITVGIIGKTGIFLVIMDSYLRGVARLEMFLVGITDVILAFFYLLHLLSLKKNLLQLQQQKNKKINKKFLKK